MQDRSFSMLEQVASGETKWTLVSRAIAAFVKDPKSAELGGGIGFFPMERAAEDPDSEYGSSCKVADYAAPSVPIASLVTSATAITQAIVSNAPSSQGGFTPTYPALEGALAHAREWAKAHPDRKTVVVLATDGQPNVCGSTPEKVTEAARAGSGGEPAIPTYVIGVFPPEDDAAIQNANQFAAAGGTENAYIIDADGAVQSQFLSALSAIRQANAVRCEFSVPPPPAGQAIDFERVSVTFEGSQGRREALSWRASAEDCAREGAGWHYDDVSQPSKIELCSATCAAVQADAGAALGIRFGCAPPSRPQ
jgi:hypothetical protein